MKRVASVMVLLAFALVTGACAGGSGSPGLALGSAPWKDGDKVSYDVVDKTGKKLGTEAISIASSGDAWVLTVVDQIAPLDQTANVRIDAKTLKPLGEEKSIKVTGTDATISTSYNAGKLDIKAVVNGENKQASIDVPDNSLDNDQLLMTLRALPFADGYEGKYVVVNGSNAAKVNTTVRVQGKESLEVPAGSFQTWKVELDFGQGKQYAWYQVDAPHQMVQYDNGSTKFVLAR